MLGDYRISSIGLEEVISMPKTNGKFDEDGNYTVKFSHSGSRFDLPNLRTKQSDLMKELVNSEYQKNKSKSFLMNIIHWFQRRFG